MLNSYFLIYSNLGVLIYGDVLIYIYDNFEVLSTLTEQVMDHFSTVFLMNKVTGWAVLLYYFVEYYECLEYQVYCQTGNAAWPLRWGVFRDEVSTTVEHPGSPPGSWSWPHLGENWTELLPMSFGPVQLCRLSQKWTDLSTLSLLIFPVSPCLSNFKLQRKLNAYYFDNRANLY